MDTVATALDALDAGRWDAAGARMVAKMLSELLYERLLSAEPAGSGTGRWTAAAGAAVYDFAARPRLYERLRVEPGSVRRGGAAASDPVRLLLDLAPAAGMDPATTAHLARELRATQLADCHIAAAPRRTAAEIVDLSWAEVEGEMDGHPWLVPNKGRIGFGHADHLLHAPERRRPQRLLWLAVREGRGEYRAVAGLDHRRLRALQLDPDTATRFEAGLRRRGEDPDRFLWFPAHPWQWDHVVLPLFAADLASGDLVVLGEGDDAHLPQQSIRTLTNVGTPGRHSVKLPVSILNTLVYRGLPTERTLAAPAVTAFLQGIAAADPFLRDRCRVVLLGEVAAVAVPHPAYEELDGAPYQYRELLGCIWREGLEGRLDPEERAMTMAALLHVDAGGRAVVADLVRRSGLTPAAWLDALLLAVLPPLLHFLYRHGVVFSPHGENAILLHRGGVPTRLAMKDFVDDVNLSDQPLPELAGVDPGLRAVLLAEPPEWLCQFLWAGLLIGHFRYLSDLMEDHLGLAERDFWAAVRRAVLDHQARFPELAERFVLFDLLAPRFARICLNRNRMLLDGYADRPERPHAATHGTVANALAEVAGVAIS
ncbi:MAG TPA: IucA/IucC family siderophore biosynthesis protein [Candidatus Dormibacteraeota bacterium]|nr:IucA/IucC family siderophore biosynthesis protein [Candidatus Dormibacteraeota bacterium]